MPAKRSTPPSPAASHRFREDRRLASLGIATGLVDATEPDLPLAYVNPAFEELTNPRAVAEIRTARRRGSSARSST